MLLLIDARAVDTIERAEARNGFDQDLTNPPLTCFNPVRLERLTCCHCVAASHAPVFEGETREAESKHSRYLKHKEWDNATQCAKYS